MRRLFLKAFSMGAMSCVKEGGFEIAKLEFNFKTEHCVSEKKNGFPIKPYHLLSH